MPAPIESKILLPDDTGNSGKQVRTVTKVVGGNTVHEHFFIPSPALTLTGHYFFSSTQQTVQAAAQNGTSTGFFWLQNPAASTVTAMLRRIIVDSNNGSVNAFPTAPVISFTKFTFTGTASGAAVVPVPNRTGAAVNQMIIRTAVTGMTISLVNDVGAFSLPTPMSGSGTNYANKEVMPFNPFAWQRGWSLELAPGEGLLVYQTTAGSTSDTRRFNVQIEWDELDLS